MELLKLVFKLKQVFSVLVVDLYFVTTIPTFETNAKFKTSSCYKESKLNL